MPQPLPLPSRKALETHLLRDVDLLKRRRAGAIDQHTIDGYVSRGWLEWHGGSLRLTPNGLRLCDTLSLALMSEHDEATDDDRNPGNPPLS